MGADVTLRFDIHSAQCQLQQESSLVHPAAIAKMFIYTRRMCLLCACNSAQPKGHAAPCFVIVAQINVAWQIEKLVGRKSLRRAPLKIFQHKTNAAAPGYGHARSGGGRRGTLWQGISVRVSVLKYVHTSTLNFDGVADSTSILLAGRLVN